MQNLIGRYALKSHGTYDSNNNFKRTSDYLKGELIYSETGAMSVIIFFKEVPETNRDFLAYSGTFKILNSKELVHQISICSNPKRDNTNEIRNYLLIENKFKLSVDLGEGSRFEAIWEKCL